ncbi:MAG: hypothetical protein IJY81_06420 [Lachnospiraceae bacterium]|nr:hypothetical protein [Lachnospira sp.]MBQ8730798.1 hypothetical protein [Lachnospiraceae bacterium]
MSNLVKGFYVTRDEADTRVIDNNEMLLKKLESIKIRLYEQEENNNADGFVAGLDVEKVENLISDEEYTANMKEMADGIVEEAKQQAQDILKEAMEQAESMKSAAYNKALEEGKKAARTEFELEKKKLEDTFNAKEKSLKEEYDKLKADMEPQLVNAILTVYNKLTNALAEVDSNVIMHLITAVLNDTDLGRNFVIKVSAEDYQFVNDNIGKLYQNVSNGAMLEVCQDDRMQKNQCIIETDAGVFDCSLDVQLEKLTKEIRMLSCI